MITQNIVWSKHRGTHFRMNRSNEKKQEVETRELELQRKQNPTPIFQFRFTLLVTPVAGVRGFVTISH